jgi:hypothetical protein
VEQIQFTVPGKPVGKERPRVIRRGGRTIVYTPQKTVKYENLVRKCFHDVANGESFTKGAMLFMTAVAYFKIPKSTSKKKMELMLQGKIRPIIKPDYDNIGKVVTDALNKIAYHDDAAVVDGFVRKFYSDIPRVEVKVEELKY